MYKYEHLVTQIRADLEIAELSMLVYFTCCETQQNRNVPQVRVLFISSKWKHNVDVVLS